MIIKKIIISFLLALTCVWVDNPSVVHAKNNQLLPAVFSLLLSNNSASPVYTITSGTFNYQEAINGQTNFLGASGVITSSNDEIPDGAIIYLRVTMNPNNEKDICSMTVAADGTFNFPYGTQQFLATGNTSATGVFSFFDQSIYGNSTFTYTDNDLTE